MSYFRDRLTGITERVSVGPGGIQGDSGSCLVRTREGNFGGRPSISASGRYVAFTSNATNLVEGDNNSAFDVFVHDRRTATTERVSVGLFGFEANGNSARLSISRRRFVAFESFASNLVEGDTNGTCDVFVHRR